MFTLQNILQWNCNGIKHHYVDLKHIMVEKVPFCICLQETHLKPGETFNLRTYKCYTKNVHPDRRARGGVAIYIKENIPAKALPLQTEMQAVAIHLCFPFKLTVCNVYLPDFTWNRNALENLISQLPTPFLILGDFNGHNPLWGSDTRDQRGRIIEDVINDNDLVLLNTGEKTYINARSNSFSAIDLTICSPEISSRFLWSVLNHSSSDHLPISLEFADSIITEESIQRWRLERADWSKFTECLTHIEITEDVINSVDLFTSAITHAAEASIPTSKGKCHRTTVPWWSNEVANAIRIKKQAFNRFKRNQTQENLILFKRARAIARRTILESKRNSWHSYVSSINVSTPTSEVWRKIRSIMGKKFPNPSPALEINGHIISNIYEVTEALADYFSNTSSNSNYNQDFLQYKRNTERDLDFSESTLSYYNEPFTMTELENALKETGNSSPGLDSIPYEIIRHLPTIYKQLLLSLYNTIWRTGIYPPQWKEAIVIPLLKQGKDPKLSSSYRPISLTCCLSKVLEKMISYRLMWYLEKNSLLSESQMGFRKHRSTIDHLVHLESVIQNNFAKRSHTVVVFFDLEKAYDLVWRFDILNTLYNWGLRGNLPCFIKTFLDGRTFRVRLENTLSQPRLLENGIPQGSTLSVVLFAIAVNELVNSLSPTIGRLLYVDDLAIYYSAKLIEDIEQNLQEAINKLVDATNRHGFRFSIPKTHCVHFCRLRSRHQHPELTLQGHVLEYKSEMRFLGVTFDEKLYWGAHIQDIAVRCRKRLNLLRCISSMKWGADREMLLRIHMTMILAKIDYGCIIYGSARKSRLKVLNSIHCTGLRLALGAFRTSPFSALCCASGIPPLQLRRQQYLVSYGAGIWAQPNHPNKKILFDEELYTLYENRPTISRPASVRLQELLNSMNEILPAVYNIGPCNIPPWKLKSPKIHLECAAYKKDETNRELLLSIFYSVINSYNECHTLYTDGSKLEQGVGSAFSDGAELYKWTLPTIASIYTAELYAILQALRHVESNAYNLTLICSDSLSAIQSLSNIFTTDPLVQTILVLIHDLEMLRKRVHFVWTPSHVGIRGNELADSAAKDAATSSPQNIKIRSDDLKTNLKQRILNLWQDEWDNGTTKLKEVKPDIRKWRTTSFLARREQSIIARLRIGHTHLTSSYLLIGGQPPRCTTCNVVLTIRHVLLDCPTFEQQRRISKIPDQLHLCLGDSITNLKSTIHFLKATNLFFKI